MKVLCTFGMSLVKDLAVDDCKDSELPKVVCTFSFMGLQEETDDISSLELSYMLLALTCKEVIPLYNLKDEVID